MKTTHVLLVTNPSQGHVIPFMDVAQRFIRHGLKVTFVNTDDSHNMVMKAWSKKNDLSGRMHMVAIPDGMEPWEDRQDLGRATEKMFSVMPGKLEELITNINKTDDDKITCIIADYCMGWVSKVAKKMGIRLAVFSSGSAAVMAVFMSVQKLIDDQIIDGNGVPVKDEMVQLAPTMPLMDPKQFLWACMGDPVSAKKLFHGIGLEGTVAAEIADYIICNSTVELEPETFKLFPKIVPIGPLLANNEKTKQSGHFWNQDFSSITWLDQQQVGSVIYVAFGSHTVISPIQFEELAQGLELMNRPFLWVVRPGLSHDTDNIYPKGFLDRIATRGKIVSWAPQQEVLNHPSVGCFMSHCGWNSTMEGVSNGVPFLCWPYFYDQFLDTTYICENWKTGLPLNKDATGIVTREEIETKVEKLMTNDKFKQNALDLQERVMNSVKEGNSSNKNFVTFIDWIKKGDI